MSAFIDQDYTDRLSPDERAFLDQFNNEFYHAGPRRKDGKNVHNDEGLKDCWRENRRRQRAQCAMAWRGTVPLLAPVAAEPADDNAEDALLEDIHEKRARAKAAALVSQH